MKAFALSLAAMAVLLPAPGEAGVIRYDVEMEIQSASFNGTWFSETSADPITPNANCNSVGGTTSCDADVEALDYPQQIDPSSYGWPARFAAVIKVDTALVQAGASQLITPVFFENFSCTGGPICNTRYLTFYEFTATGFGYETYCCFGGLNSIAYDSRYLWNTDNPITFNYMFGDYVMDFGEVKFDYGTTSLIISAVPVPASSAFMLGAIALLGAVRLKQKRLPDRGAGSDTAPNPPS